MFHSCGLVSCFAGQRIIKVAKSPMTPPLAFPFHITSAGISLLSDEGTELKGPGINNIHARGIILCHRVNIYTIKRPNTIDDDNAGHNDMINFNEDCS